MKDTADLSDIDLVCMALEKGGLPQIAAYLRFIADARDEQDLLRHEAALDAVDESEGLY